MSKPKVFIDGQEGTTGLQIDQRLGSRQDIELLRIDPDKRKDPEERRKFLNEADLVFLCLPDAAAVEASITRVLGLSMRPAASTAHRTADGWVYGFPELLPGQRQRIKYASRVANPGCHATGFLACAAPLVELGVLPKDYPVTCFSLTGYSGGGKKMIAEYEDPNRDPILKSPSVYATGLRHKHLPEMQKLSGLAEPPAFAPILGDIYKGMATSILLQNRLLSGRPTAEDIWDMLSAYYEEQTMVRMAPFGGDAPRLAAGALAGKDFLQLTVSGHEEQTMITAQFDNLGKGASGAAVQNMNIMLGFEETAGLNL